MDEVTYALLSKCERQRGKLEAVLHTLKDVENCLRNVQLVAAEEEREAYTGSATAYQVVAVKALRDAEVFISDGDMAVLMNHVEEKTATHYVCSRDPLCRGWIFVPPEDEYSKGFIEPCTCGEDREPKITNDLQAIVSALADMAYSPNWRGHKRNMYWGSNSNGFSAPGHKRSQHLRIAGAASQTLDRIYDPTKYDTELWSYVDDV